MKKKQTNHWLAMGCQKSTRGAACKRVRQPRIHCWRNSLISSSHSVSTRLYLISNQIIVRDRSTFEQWSDLPKTQLMSVEISVIIPSYNPNSELLNRVLANLQSQTMTPQKWELIIVDSASSTPLTLPDVVTTYNNYKLVRLDQSGLTRARLKGMQEAQGDLLVFVDDDVLLREDYLQNALSFLHEHKDVGVVGGKNLPEFEAEPASWTKAFYEALAIRDPGDQVLISKLQKDISPPFNYPRFAPVGAGMVLRKEVAECYLKTRTGDAIPDRSGSKLSSGGDCDINLVAIENGFQLAYSPDLVLWHVIAKERLSVNYLGNLLHATARSWVEVLDLHQSCPWTPANPKFSFFRKCKAYVRTRAYLSKPNWLRWKEACGYIEGRGRIYKKEKAANSLKELLVNLGAGKLLYQVYYKPRKLLLTLNRIGPMPYLLALKGQRQMIHLARIGQFAPTDSASSHNENLKIHMLTGEKYWHQTLFCLRSLQMHANINPVTTIYDDGTLRADHIERLKNLFPDTTIISIEQVQKNIDKVLPEKYFQNLRSLRLTYPHIRKLIDVHCYNPDWKLVFDSDMLFFKRPDLILDWQNSHSQPIAMTDVENSYGYPFEAMEELANCSLIEKINVGVIGMDGKQIDWEELEHWCLILQRSYGMHYCLEQALYAMLISRNGSILQLPKSEYIVAPKSMPEPLSSTALHHYVADSRFLYFTQAWKAIG